MPITTIQDANSIRGMSRCTRCKFYVTNICQRLVVDGLYNNKPWATMENWTCVEICVRTKIVDFFRGYNTPSLFQNLQ